jgi:hypothetical protein
MTGNISHFVNDHIPPCSGPPITRKELPLGTLGGHLLVFNAGGSPDTVAITDSGLTPAGQAGVSTGGSVTNATNEAFYISPKQADPATGLVTITHSFTTSVTCLFIPLG